MELKEIPAFIIIASEEDTPTDMLEVTSIVVQS